MAVRARATRSVLRVILLTEENRVKIRLKVISSGRVSKVSLRTKRLERSRKGLETSERDWRCFWSNREKISSSGSEGKSRIAVEELKLVLIRFDDSILGDVESFTRNPRKK
ncbi:unnamed protein product [Rhodiola kirilowii]